MIPVYEAYLGFNPEMIAMILAFNIILDPLITCSNVVANGALCRVFEKNWIKLLNITSTNQNYLNQKIIVFYEVFTKNFKKIFNLLTPAPLSFQIRNSKVQID